ncbi:MAG: saccharopine dehydrogenase NADP-binding domain-containing protein [Nitriliruptorales bacterium]|nr:saccharopine dehydrogenase NADP-binding domain-containing protein [Nitriliruptorales bacterium]
MATIALLGASGFTGRLVAAELDRRGHAFVAAGRDTGRLREAVAGLSATDVVAVDVTDAASVHALVSDVDLVLTTVGPFQQLGRGVLAAAIESDTHYVDSTGEQPFIRWAFERWGEVAAARGVSVVPAAAFDHVPGDLLGHVAASALRVPEELHVAYLAKAPGGLLNTGSSGTRASVASLMGETILSVVDGRLREEDFMAERRLAWFPRPVGPHHAAGTGGAEPFTIPRHVPGLRVVRSYTAMPTWQAEVGQLLSGVAGRSTRLRDLLQRTLSQGPEGPSERSRQATRIAAVAEAATGGSDPAIARAWLSGRDIYRFTAVCMVLIAERILGGGVPPGVIAPAETGAATALLDELAVRADVQWSVITP